MTDGSPAMVTIRTDDLLAAYSCAWHRSGELRDRGDYGPNRFDALMCRLEAALAAAYYEANR